MKFFIKQFIFIFLLLIGTANAAVLSWKILPAQSRLTFTATQNNAPITGEFKKFSGQIHFSPDQLNESNVSIEIDIASLTAAYQDVVTTLNAVDWFDTKVFPKAVFKANRFKKVGDKNFIAQGFLTIRDKTVPVDLQFTLDEFSQTKSVVTGSALLKRTQFGVGQGEWAKTDAIKDEVTINFKLVAEP